MPTRRKRTKRKSRKGGDWFKSNKTWADNYRNCMNQTKDDPIGTLGGKTADGRWSETMVNLDYRSENAEAMKDKEVKNAESWTDHKRGQVPKMWYRKPEGKWVVVNGMYKKNKYQWGDVVHPEWTSYIQQFETKPFWDTGPRMASDNPLEEQRKLAMYSPQPYGPP